MRVLIKYHDGSGQITEREISDLRKENESNIDAFCHTREERRTFNLDRILHAVSPDTGELLNPYQLVPLMRDSESLDTLTWKSRQAIKALKLFSLTTRGFAKRERKHIDAFVKSLVNTSSRTDEDISEWVYCLWCACRGLMKSFAPVPWCGSLCDHTEMTDARPEASYQY